jgi:hypothetical protein
MAPTSALLAATLTSAAAAALPYDPSQYALIGSGGAQMLTSSAGVRWVLEGLAPNGTVVTVPDAGVPGQAHLALERAGLIANTYADDNFAVNDWVRQTAWRYSANFTLDPGIAACAAAAASTHPAVAAAASEVFLVFDGVDTLGRVYLNTAPPPLHPAPAPAPTPALDACFHEMAHTLPEPRLDYNRSLPGTPRPACEAACVGDVLCSGFSMVDPSGPDAKGCWIYHNVTQLSNASGDADGDWYALDRAAAPACKAPPPPPPTPPDGALGAVNDQFLRFAFPAGQALRGEGGSGDDSGSGTGSNINTLVVQLAATYTPYHQDGGYWAHVRKSPTDFGCVQTGLVLPPIVITCLLAVLHARARAMPSSSRRAARLTRVRCL